MQELTIYDYVEPAKENEMLSFYDVASVLLKDIDCVICLESASDLLGFSNLGFIKKIHIYTTEYINKPYLECHIVDNLDTIPYETYKNVKVSPIEVALVEMLKDENTDSQVLYETFAKYYYKNNDSYNKLIIPNTLKAKAKHYMDEGRLFYGS